MVYFFKRALFYCACILYASQYLRTGFYVDDVLLVVGILSAQNNSATRYGIRHTWKNLVSKTNSKFYFLVGKDFCLTHPSDRISEESCQELSIKWPPDLPHNHGLWTSESSKSLNLKPPQNVVTSFTFRTHFPVILRGMRVIKDAIASSHGVIALLKNAQNGEFITSLQFNYHESKVLHTGDTWEVGGTKPYLLPRNFDGEFQLFSLSSLNKSDLKPMSFNCVIPSNWFDLFGTIMYTAQYSLNTGWIPVSNNSCIPMSLQLELYDLQTHFDQKDIRRNQWTNEIKVLSRDLNVEADVEKDILFLDVIDVYENLPKKLLSFYKWIYENVKFQFILKADDDTFVDIPIIEKYLSIIASSERKLQKETHLWWWGNLRFGLPVARHGKWQELLYRAPVYPPFPCGGGYVLHRNIIKFLVSNFQWLHYFQGEDTSLGIWLSGVQPNHPEDTSCRWTCSNVCEISLCNKIQLSVEDMYSVWQQYQNDNAKLVCQTFSKRWELFKHFEGFLPYGYTYTVSKVQLIGSPGGPS